MVNSYANDLVNNLEDIFNCRTLYFKDSARTHTRQKSVLVFNLWQHKTTIHSKISCVRSGVIACQMVKYGIVYMASGKRNKASHEMVVKWIDDDW